MGAGWSDEDAEAIVEEARKLTRSARGVTTLDAVRRLNDRTHHATAYTRWTAAFPALNAVLAIRRSLTRLITRRR